MTEGAFSVEYEFSVEFYITADEAFDSPYILDSLTITPESSTLSFHAERQSPASYLADFNKALVSLTLNDELIFGGQVTMSTISHDRVNITAEGIGNIIDRMPIHGARRKAADAFVKNTHTIFNEFGKKDKQPSAATNTCTVSDTNLDSADDEDNEAKWTRGEVASYCASICREVQNPMMSDLIQWDNVIAGGGINPLRNLGKSFIDDDQQIVKGLASYIAEIAKSDNYIAYFYATQSAYDGLMGTLRLVQYYLPANKKTVTYNPTTTSSLESVPYTFSYGRDYSAPNEVYLFTGKRYMSTILEIDLGKIPEILDTEDEYGEIIEEDDKKLTVRYSYDFSDPGSSSNTLFEGPILKEVILNSKCGTLSNVFPRIKDYAEVQAGQPAEFLDEFEVYVKFDPSAFSDETSVASEILIGGKIWNGLKNNTESSLHSALKELGIVQMFEDHLYFTVNANKLIVEMSGIPNAKDDDGKYKTLVKLNDLVEYIRIPVVVELDDRDIYKATITEDPSFSIDAQAVDPTSLFYNLKTDNVEVLTYDDLHPLERRYGFDSYSSGSGIDIANDEDTFEDQMKKEVKDRARNLYNNANNSMTITIPIELFVELSASFPKEIGDWIDKIDTSDSSLFTAVDLKRGYTLTSISYSLDSVTLNFT